MIDPNSYAMMTSGARYYLMDPGSSTILLGDAAGALSRICRFGGHISDEYEDDIYSVAQHSVYVEMLLNKFGQYRSQFWGLTHDLMEGAYGDTITPLKKHFPKLTELEETGARVMRMQWGIPFDSDIEKEVHWADQAMGCAEAFALKGTNHAQQMYDCEVPPFNMTDLDPDFRPWRPAKSKQRFIKRFHELKKQVNDQENTINAHTH